MRVPTYWLRYSIETFLLFKSKNAYHIVFDCCIGLPLEKTVKCKDITVTGLEIQGVQLKCQMLKALVFISELGCEPVSLSSLKA